MTARIDNSPARLLQLTPPWHSALPLARRVPSDQTASRIANGRRVRENTMLPLEVLTYSRSINSFTRTTPAVHLPETET